MNDAPSLLSLLTAPPERVAAAGTVREFFAATSPTAGSSAFEDGIARALAADRPGYALASGHQAAVRALFPDLPEGITAFCASEERGAHPRYIATRLEESQDAYRLSGEKRWASLAPQADQLIVVASRGATEGRNDLVCVVVPANAAGTTLTPLEAPGLAPEVGHAIVTFEAVEVAPQAVLPGDGYVDAVKPFRTYEDLYIAAALQAATLRCGIDFGWPKDLLEDTLGIVLAAAALAREDLRTPASHIGLSSLSRRCEELDAHQQQHWAASPLAERWVRTVEPPAVAARAKERRREVAWERFSEA
ncbi:MAG: acyl-CoA dehydrogenase family protein [Acidobacteriota bacterium]